MPDFDPITDPQQPDPQLPPGVSFVDDENQSPFWKFKSAFQSKFSHPLDVTGDMVNNPMHRTAAKRNAFDVRTKDLSPEHLSWMDQNVGAYGLKAIKSTGKEPWSTGPHWHLEPIEAQAQAQTPEAALPEGVTFADEGPQPQQTGPATPATSPVVAVPQPDLTADQPVTLKSQPGEPATPPEPPISVQTQYDTQGRPVGTAPAAIPRTPLPESFTPSEQDIAGKDAFKSSVYQADVGDLVDIGPDGKAKLKPGVTEQQFLTGLYGSATTAAGFTPEAAQRFMREQGKSPVGRFFQGADPRATTIGINQVLAGIKQGPAGRPMYEFVVPPAIKGQYAPYTNPAEEEQKQNLARDIAAEKATWLDKAVKLGLDTDLPFETLKRNVEQAQEELIKGATLGHIDPTLAGQGEGEKYTTPGAEVGRLLGGVAPLAAAGALGGPLATGLMAAAQPMLERQPNESSYDFEGRLKGALVNELSMIPMEAFGVLGGLAQGPLLQPLLKLTGGGLGFAATQPLLHGRMPEPEDLKQFMAGALMSLAHVIAERRGEPFGQQHVEEAKRLLLKAAPPEIEAALSAGPFQAGPEGVGQVPATPSARPNLDAVDQNRPDVRIPADLQVQPGAQPGAATPEAQKPARVVYHRDTGLPLLVVGEDGNAWTVKNPRTGNTYPINKALTEEPVARIYLKSSGEPLDVRGQTPDGNLQVWREKGGLEDINPAWATDQKPEWRREFSKPYSTQEAAEAGAKRFEATHPDITTDVQPAVSGKGYHWFWKEGKIEAKVEAPKTEPGILPEESSLPEGVTFADERETEGERALRKRAEEYGDQGEGPDMTPEGRAAGEARLRAMGFPESGERRAIPRTEEGPLTAEYTRATTAPRAFRIGDEVPLSGGRTGRVVAVGRDNIKVEAEVRPAGENGPVIQQIETVRKEDVGAQQRATEGAAASTEAGAGEVVPQPARGAVENVSGVIKNPRFVSTGRTEFGLPNKGEEWGTHDIMDADGNRVGTAQIEIRGDTAYVHDIGDLSTPLRGFGYGESLKNRLGVAGVKSLMRSLKEQYPEVKKIEGMRQTGMAPGHEATYNLRINPQEVGEALQRKYSSEATGIVIDKRTGNPLRVLGEAPPEGLRVQNEQTGKEYNIHRNAVDETPVENIPAAHAEMVQAGLDARQRLDAFKAMGVEFKDPVQMTGTVRGIDAATGKQESTILKYGSKKKTTDYTVLGRFPGGQKLLVFAPDQPSGSEIRIIKSPFGEGNERVKSGGSDADRLAMSRVPTIDWPDVGLLSDVHPTLTDVRRVNPNANSLADLSDTELRDNFPQVWKNINEAEGYIGDKAAREAVSEGAREPEILPEEKQQGPQEPKFVSDARERLRRSQNKLSMNPIDAMYDAAITAGYDIYKTTKDFVEWSKELVKQLGEKASEFTWDIWSKLEHDPEVAIRAAEARQLFPATEGLARDAEKRGNELVFRMIRDPQEAKAVLDSMRGYEQGELFDERAKGFNRAKIVDGQSVGKKSKAINTAEKKGAIPVFTSPYPTVAHQYQEGSGVLVAIEHAPEGRIYTSSRAGSTQSTAYSGVFADSEHVVDAKSIKGVYVLTPSQQDTIARHLENFQAGYSRGAYVNAFKDKDSALMDANMEAARNLEPVKKSLNRPFLEAPIDLPNGLRVKKGDRVRFDTGGTAILNSWSRMTDQEKIDKYWNGEADHFMLGGVKGDIPTRDVWRYDADGTQRTVAEPDRSNMAASHITAVWDKGSRKWIGVPEREIEQTQAQGGILPEEPDTVAKSRARLKQSLSGNTLSMNPVQSFYDTAVTVGWDVYKAAKNGIANFEDWSKDMIKRLGENVKPHLESAWDAITKPAPVWFSPLERQLKLKMSNKMPADQLRAMLGKAGLSRDELEWSGFNEFLRQKANAGETITKKDALDFIDRNQIQVNDTWHGEKSEVKWETVDNSGNVFTENRFGETGMMSIADENGEHLATINRNNPRYTRLMERPRYTAEPIRTIQAGREQAIRKATSPDGRTLYVVPTTSGTVAPYIIMDQLPLTELPEGHVLRKAGSGLDEYWSLVKTSPDGRYDNTKARFQAGNEKAALNEALTVLDSEHEIGTARNIEQATGVAERRLGAVKDVKFGDYVTPGGKNQRELLLTQPLKTSPLVTWSDPEEVERNFWAEGGGKENTKEWTASDGARITYQSKRGYVINSELVQNAAQPTLAKAMAFYQEQKSEAESKYAGRREALGNYRSPHWDEPNVLAHVRMNDRDIPIESIKEQYPDLYERLKSEGKDTARGLHIEEAQSDWQQTSRKMGVRLDPDKVELVANETGRSGAYKNFEVRTKDGRFVTNVSTPYTNEVDTPEQAIKFARQRLKEERQRTGDRGVPAAPFQKNWQDMAFKRMLRESSEKGYDLMTWSTGAEQFKRWGSQRVDWARNDLRAIPFSEYAKTHGLIVKPEDIDRWVVTTPEGRGTGPDRMDYTEATKWVKDNPRWSVLSKEQSGGHAGGVDIEGEALRQNILKADYQAIDSKASLRNLLEATMDREEDEYSPENWKKHMDTMTDKVWGRMQSEDVGTHMPRKEGMEGFYDKMIPDFARSYGKRYGAKVGTVGLDALQIDKSYRPKFYMKAEENGKWTVYATAKAIREEGFTPGGVGTFNTAKEAEDFMAAGNRTPMHSIDISLKMRDSVIKIGQSLFGSQEAEPPAVTDSLVRLQEQMAQKKRNPPKAELQRVSSGRITETPEFKNWFASSKIVDTQGQPLRVLHGTSRQFQQFDLKYATENELDRQTAGAGKAIWFTTDPEVAAGFSELDASFQPQYRRAGDLTGQNIRPAFLRIENPQVIDLAVDMRDIDDILSSARHDGHDGVIFSNANENILNERGELDRLKAVTTYAVFDPSQIQSAISPDVQSIVDLKPEELAQFPEAAQKLTEVRQGLGDKAGTEAVRHATTEILPEEQKTEAGESERVQNSRQWLRDHWNGGELGAGQNLIPAMYHTVIVTGADIMKAGKYVYGKAEDFAAWSKDMIVRLGDRAKPYLDEVWNRLNEQAPQWFSPLENTIKLKMPNKASADQVKGILRGGGFILKGEGGIEIPNDEAHWTGLYDFLQRKSSAKEQVTKQEVLDHLATNRVQLTEKQFSEAEVSRLNDERMENEEEASSELDRLLLEEHPKGDPERERWQQNVRDARWKLAQLRVESKPENLAPKFAAGGWVTPGGTNQRELTLALKAQPKPDTRQFGLNSEYRMIRIRDLQSEDIGRYGSDTDNREYAANIGAKLDDWIVVDKSGAPVVDIGLPAQMSQREALGVFMRDTEDIGADMVHEIGRTTSGEQGVYKVPGAHQYGIPEADINRIAIIRTNDRTGPNGEKILHVDEYQDDLQNQIQALKKQVKDLESKGELTDEYPRALTELNHLESLLPFRGKSHELAFKRMLDYAVKNGYDKLTWATGQQVADRYDLSKYYDEVGYDKNKDGTFDLSGIAKGENNRRAIASNVPVEKLEEYGGKELAQKIIAGEGEKDEANKFEVVSENGRWYARQSRGQIGNRPFDVEYSSRQEAQNRVDELQSIHGTNLRVLKGVDLQIGGEGKKTLYDNLIPNFLSKYTKRWGGKVRETEIGGGSYQLRFDSGPYTGEVYKGPGDEEGPSTFADRETADRYIRERSFPGHAESVSYNVHSIDITPEMKDAINKTGQPLFGTSEGEHPMVVNARARLAETFSGKKLSMNPVQDMLDMALVAGAETYKVAKKFGGWSNQMVKRLGDEVRPYLKQTWEKLKLVMDINTPGQGGFIRNPFNSSGRIPAERVERTADELWQDLVGGEETEPTMPLPGRQQRTGGRVPFSPIDSEGNIVPREPTSFIRTLDMYRKANMLMSLSPWLHKVGSLIGNATAGEVVQPITAGIDAVRSAFPGQSRALLWDPIGIGKAAAKTISKDTAVEVGQIMKRGYTDDQLEQYGLPNERTGRNPVLSALINYTFRTFKAGVHPFQTYAYERSMHEQAKLLALGEQKAGILPPGLSLEARTMQIKNGEGIGEGSVATMEGNALLAAADETFQANNPLYRKIQDIKGLGGDAWYFGVNSIVPFAKAPSNAILKALEMAPGVGATYRTIEAVNRAFGYDKKAFADPQDLRKFEKAWAMLPVGTALFALGAALHSHGRMTSLGYKTGLKDDEGNRKTKVPGALLIDGHQIDIARYSPIGLIMAMGATYDEKRGDAVQTGNSWLTDFYRSIANKDILEKIPLLSQVGMIGRWMDTGNLPGSFKSMPLSLIPGYATGRDVMKGWKDQSGPVAGYVKQVTHVSGAPPARTELRLLDKVRGQYGEPLSEEGKAYVDATADIAKSVKAKNYKEANQKYEGYVKTGVFPPGKDNEADKGLLNRIQDHAQLTPLQYMVKHNQKIDVEAALDAFLDPQATDADRRELGPILNEKENSWSKAYESGRVPEIKARRIQDKIAKATEIYKRLFAPQQKASGQ